MFNKRFLVPVLALVAFGMTASADVVGHCDNGCGANTTAAFNNLITSTPYTYAYGLDQTFTSPLTSSTEYIDVTGITFSDTSGTFLSAALPVLETSGTTGKILITVPAAYSAIQLSLSSASGASNFTCIDAGCDGTQLSTTPIFIDYIDTDPGSSWTIQISASSPESIIVDGFNPASLGGGDSGGSPTPEVGTLLLIGFGLVAMRWMRRVPRRIFTGPQTA